MPYVVRTASAASMSPAASVELGRAVDAACATRTRGSGRTARPRPSSWRRATRARPAARGRAHAGLLRRSSSARTCSVLPRPMSSARHTPRPQLVGPPEPLRRRRAGTDGACASSPPGSTCGQRVGAREPVEDALHPRPGLDARPGGGLVDGGVASSPMRAPASEAHAPRGTTCRRAAPALDLLPVVQHLAQPRAVGLDPPPFDEHEPARVARMRRLLGGGERLAVERERHGEVEHRVGADARRRASAASPGPGAAAAGARATSRARAP